MATTLSKKLGQFRQWTGEKLGTTERTKVSEEFKTLDIETETRKDGIEKLAISLTDYAKTLDKRSSQDKKISALSMLSKSMIQQGRFHGDRTKLGLALLKIGEVEDGIQNLQDRFAEITRRGLLVEMMALHTSVKDYAALKKKLENRRLDYDAKLNKFTKSKKEKPGLEEEVKIAENKYNETLQDVENLMSTFASREEALLEPLIEFANAQFEFFKQSLQSLEKLQGELKEESLQSQLEANTLNPDKTAMVRKGSKLQTVLPPGVTSSADSLSVRSPSKVSLKKPQEPEVVPPAAISNVSRNASLRRSTGHPPSTEQLFVEALYDFEAENEGELSIKKGDIIQIVRQIDEGWWLGVMDGREGIFPANYVKKKEKSHIVQREEDHPKPRIGEAHPKYQADENRSKSRVAESRPNHQIDGDLRKNTPLGTIEICHECGCNDFIANVFKPGKCKNCFHVH